MLKRATNRLREFCEVNTFFNEDLKQAQRGKPRILHKVKHNTVACINIRRWRVNWRWFHFASRVCNQKKSSNMSGYQEHARTHAHASWYWLSCSICNAAAVLPVIKLVEMVTVCTVQCWFFCSANIHQLCRVWSACAPVNRWLAAAAVWF